jgi:type III secretion system YscQ/HrcQ family protein
VSVSTPDPDALRDPRAAEASTSDAGPLGFLPRLSRRQVELEDRLARCAPPEGWLRLEDILGTGIATGRVEVLWRASGLRRPGFVAQLSWPRWSTRLALGVETPVAHAFVDRLLGFERLDVEGRLQLTPVEWGVLTYVLATSLTALAGGEGPLGPWDLQLDRAGPDAFDIQGLGSIVTLRWPVRVGPVAGSVRLWLPESLVQHGLAAEPRARDEGTSTPPAGAAELTGLWTAEAGTIDMPRGLASLRVGGVLPLTGSPLRGTPRSPSGPVALAMTVSGTGQRYLFPAEPAPHSGGGLLSVTAPLQRNLATREALAVNPPSSPTSSPAGPGGGVGPTDIPVTLTVELGRVNLTLSRLADLKPGDVVELGRHSREPVELTSGGRLVARGELVLIDTELGVRVTSVFL